jgi:hypothetical protein
MNIEPLKRELEEEIKHRNYDSLVYVLFDESNTTPFAVHLFYKNHLFMVNSRDDRSYVLGKTFEFTNFIDAKEKFFNILDFIVREGRREVAKRGSYMYSSPLWDDYKN